MGNKKNKENELKKKADSILAIRRQIEEDSTKRYILDQFKLTFKDVKKRENLQKKNQKEKKK